MPTTRRTINLNEIFSLIDKHGKGKVEVARIGDLLRYSGLNPSEQVCSQIISKVTICVFTLIINRDFR